MFMEAYLGIKKRCASGRRRHTASPAYSARLHYRRASADLESKTWSFCLPKGAPQKREFEQLDEPASGAHGGECVPRSPFASSPGVPLGLPIGSRRVPGRADGRREALVIKRWFQAGFEGTPRRLPGRGTRLKNG